MSKQHYHASTYKAQNSVGYLIKRAQSMMLDVLEQVFEEPVDGVIVIERSRYAKLHRGISATTRPNRPFPWFWR